MSPKTTQDLCNEFMDFQNDSHSSQDVLLTKEIQSTSAEVKLVFDVSSNILEDISLPQYMEDLAEKIKMGLIQALKHSENTEYVGTFSVIYKDLMEEYLAFTAVFLRILRSVSQGDSEGNVQCHGYSTNAQNFLIDHVDESLFEREHMEDLLWAASEQANEALQVWLKSYPEDLVEKIEKEARKRFINSLQKV